MFTPSLALMAVVLGRQYDGDRDSVRHVLAQATRYFHLQFLLSAVLDELASILGSAKVAITRTRSCSIRDYACSVVSD